MKLGMFDRLFMASVTQYMRRRHKRPVKRRIYRARRLNGKFSLAIPLSADDKFLWRKIFDHDPRHTVICDKLELRNWIAQEGIEVAFPRVLWVGRDVEQMPEDVLRGHVVAKANHACKTNLFVEHEEDPLASFKELGPQWLAFDHGDRFNEWGYFGIDRRLFVEERVGGAFSDVEEVKVYMMGSWIGRIVRTVDRLGENSGQVYDPDPNGGDPVLAARPPAVCDRVSDKPLPKCWGRIIELAREIGSRFDHMRVDFLTDGRSLWLSELTVYNQTGIIELGGEDPDSEISRRWDIRRSWFLTTPQKGWRRFYAWRLRRILDRAAEA